MKKLLTTRIIHGVTICTMLITSLSLAAIPHLFWKQKDIAATMFNQNTLHKKLLIASRGEEFKVDLVKKVAAAFASDSVWITIVGVNQLIDQNPADYQAVLIINTCMAWGMDPKVDAFIKRSATPNRIIVLTTSGNGTWMPKEKGRTYDAVASASVAAQIQPLSQSIVAKIRHVLLR